jgi:hypothetical protein
MEMTASSITPATSSASPRLLPIGGFLLIGIIALLGAGKTILADSLDPDCFWHLRVADAISNESFPSPLVDNLSFSSRKTPWVPYSWLAELGMKKLWDAGGYRAAVAATAILETAFLFALGLCAVELTRAVYGQPRFLAAALATVAGAVWSMAYLSFRPVTAVLAVLAITAWLLLRDRRMLRKSRAVWLVPLFTALATNFHFFAFLIPLWTALLCAGDILQKSGNRRRAFLLFALCFIASLLTPMLPGSVKSIVYYSMNDPMVKFGHIAELMPFWNGIMGRISAVLVAIMLICLMARALIWRWRISPSCSTVYAPLSRASVGIWLWLISGFALLLWMGRMAPVFAIIGVPVFAVALPNLSDRLLSKPIAIFPIAAVFCLMLGRIISEFPAASTSLDTFLNRNGGTYPTAAADFVDNLHKHGNRLICEWPFGGYFEWRFAGKYQTLMDGRTQVFRPEFWQSAVLPSTESEREEFLKSVHADIAIISATNSIYFAPLTKLNWQVVYRDKNAMVMFPG